MLALVAGGVAIFSAVRDGDGDTDGDRGSSAAPAEDVPGCSVPRRLLNRVLVGYYPERSGDVLAIEALPHQFGTRHSGPHPYTQDVPLVLYGPGFIRSGVEATGNPTLADLAPTFAELMGYDGFPERDGDVLEQAVLPESERNGVPKLLVTVVWDGGGDNVLEQWPDAWPHLKDLMKRGTSYDNAIVGSSPSITPSVHATIGTGAFPDDHGLTDIKIRIGEEILDAWENGKPRYLETKTLGDLWDRDNNNTPLVGTLARDHWHLGMLGHGSALKGADTDVGVLDSFQGLFFRDDLTIFRTPDYLLGEPDLTEEVAALDELDGESDGTWHGNEIPPNDPIVRYTPAWPAYQTDRIVELLTKEGFGADDVPDLFYTNYKGSDLAGHEWNMVDPEVRDTLKAQDDELPRLIEALDQLVGPDSYVLALTADHGMTPYPEVTGGWDISTAELSRDIEREFNPDRTDGNLVMSQRGYQIMLDMQRAEDVGVTAAEVAEFVRGYTLEDNVNDDNRERFEEDFQDRASERLYMTALTPDELRAASDCAT